MRLIFGHHLTQWPSDYYRCWQRVAAHSPSFRSLVYNEVVIAKLLIQIRFRMVSQQEHEDVVPGCFLSTVVSHCHTAIVFAILAQKERSR